MNKSLEAQDGNGSAIEIEERAAEFIQHRRYWNWSEENQARLDAWLNESLSHKAAYWRLEAGLVRAERLSALSGPSSREPMPVSKTLIKATIAVFVLALLIGGAAFIFRPDGQTYSTGIGKRQTVALRDGSKIDLNTDTSVHVEISGDRRFVALNHGEAYFQIAHEEASPFVVTANGHRITVLGTTFSIRADFGRTEIALYEGRVWYSDGQRKPSVKNSALLTSGDVLVSANGKTSVGKESAADISRKIGWRRGVLVFGNTTLTEAASEFNRYNQRKIVIANTTIGGLRVGGTFPTTDVDDFTHLVQSVLGLHVENHADMTIVSR
jgi:transmembrane sensor